MKYLIAGLGNIGPQYENTRHNIGFKVLDALAESSNTSFEPDRHAFRATFKHKGRTFILIKPTTFMNRSGKAIRYWLQAEKIPVENLLVIIDDIALPFGTLRMRMKGSDGGHNGLKDIQNTLGHNKYNRIRFGVGNEFHSGQQVDYVLGEWSLEEKKGLPERLEQTTKMVLSFGSIGAERTMNFFNNS